MNQKCHLVVDTMDLLLAFIVTVASGHDRDAGTSVGAWVLSKIVNSASDDILTAVHKPAATRRTGTSRVTPVR